MRQIMMVRTLSNITMKIGYDFTSYHCIQYFLLLSIGVMEEEGCKYDWCLTIPQIHMAQFFIQYYISVVAFPFCTTLIAAVFSCVLGDIPQVLFINSIDAFI